MNIIEDETAKNNLELTTYNSDNLPENETNLDIEIPQDVSSFIVHTKGNVKGDCDYDKKFIVHKKYGIYLTKFYRIELNSRDVDLRKARTNTFKANVKNNFLIHSSLEANYLDIKASGDFTITKKLGVPTNGNIETSKNIDITSIYGPTHHIGDFLTDYDSALKDFRERSVNINNPNKSQINIGHSHGNLNVQAPLSKLSLNAISNTSLFVRISFYDIFRLKLILFKLLLTKSRTFHI